MTDINFEDLANDRLGKATEETVEKAAEDVGMPTSEFLLELVDRLEDRGLLAPLIYGPEGMKEIEGEQAPTSDPDGGGPDLDAEAVATIGKQVIDQLGDVQMSQIVLLCEQKPDMVNKLIEDNL